MGTRTTNVIYKLTSPSGKVYIGQTSNFEKRMKEYARHDCANQKKLHRAILKYGWASFKTEVIDSYHGLEVADGLDALETYYISFYDSVATGYNCCLTGNSQLGVKRSRETIDKLRASHLGFEVADATKEKLRLITTGVKRSESSIEKSRVARTGMKRSPEFCSRMSILKKGTKTSDATKKLISDERSGKKKSPETIEKMKAAWVVRKQMGAG